MDNSIDLTVSPGPHIKSGETTAKIMYNVVLALIPAVIAAVYFYDVLALQIILTASISAVCFEYIVQKITDVSVTIKDGSALVTGLLLGLSLPPTVPIWMTILGSFVAIVIGKYVFGGLGNNIFNPALVGRAFLTVSFTEAMTDWTVPYRIPQFLAQFDFFTSLREGLGITDVFSSATPLAGAEVETVNLFLGRVGGSLGETSAIALIIGGVYLIYKGYIDWVVPISYIGTVLVLTTFIGDMSPIVHLFSGALILSAFFMTTDMTTSPITRKGRLIFGIGCGFLLVIIRVFADTPGGVQYAILLMNMIVPLLDQYTVPRIYGEVSTNG